MSGTNLRSAATIDELQPRDGASFVIGVKTSRPEHGETDVFVHVSTLQQGGSLREGDNITFEVGQDRKTGKSKAENVSVL